MLQTLRDNLESFEAINQDVMTRDLVLRMSALSQAGKLGPFLFELTHDSDLDDLTKGTLVEIATDPPGFTLDEPIESLGESLKLPSWLEGQRARVERALPPLTLNPGGKK